MSNPPPITSPSAALIDSWLARHLKAEGWSWLNETLARLALCAPAEARQALFIAFGLAARRVGKQDLGLDADELAAAERIRPGWRPAAWSCDQAARTRLALCLPADDAQSWLASLDALFASSGVEEQIALYQALPLLPHPERLRLRAAEGVRSNMTPVFAAVALDNPYPADWLDDHAFNHVVVKCLFVDAPLSRVVGLERRANADLARTLCDLARERWAAGRTLHADVWAVLARCAGDDARGVLERAAASKDMRESVAARAALAVLVGG